jgi:integrase
VVPGSASKNGKEHRVWMSELALAQLEAHPWAAQREAVQKWLTHNAEGWTAHDLRRTFSTRNNAMGVPPYIVEKMLNHSFDGVMAVYNQATYDAERRQALEAWSAWLADLIGKQPANVVSLRQVSPKVA